MRRYQSGALQKDLERRFSIENIHAMEGELESGIEKVGNATQQVLKAGCFSTSRQVPSLGRDVLLDIQGGGSCFSTLGGASCAGIPKCSTPNRVSCLPSPPSLMKPPKKEVLSRNDTDIKGFEDALNDTGLLNLTTQKRPKAANA